MALSAINSRPAATTCNHGMPIGPCVAVLCIRSEPPYAKRIFPNDFQKRDLRQCCPGKGICRNIHVGQGVVNIVRMHAPASERGSGYFDFGPNPNKIKRCATVCITPGVLFYLGSTKQSGYAIRTLCIVF